jgi:hypothetical protein
MTVSFIQSFPEGLDRRLADLERGIVDGEISIEDYDEEVSPVLEDVEDTYGKTAYTFAMDVVMETMVSYESEFESIKEILPGEVEYEKKLTETASGLEGSYIEKLVDRLGNPKTYDLDPVRGN